MNIRIFLAAPALVATIAGPGLAQRNAINPYIPPSFSSAPTPQAKQFRLGHLIIIGNTHTKEFVIRRMIPLSEGDIFNQSLWEFGLEQVNRSGLFDTIQQTDIVLTADPATGLIDAALHLKERDHQRVDLSGGGGTTGGASIAFDYANINLTGRGDRLIARARIGTRERSGGASFSTMTYGKLPISLETSGFFERLEFVNAATLEQGREPLFIEKTAGGSIGAFLPLNRSRYTIAATTRVGLVYSFTSTNLADALFMTTSSPRTLEQGGLRIASLTALLLHDTLDRELDPQRGERIALGAELGARPLGGSLNSFRPFFDYRRFWAQGNKNDESREPRAVGFRIRASHIRSFGESFREQALSTVRGVPVFRRFFLGGETEIRGYDVNSIAPLARVERFVSIDPNTSPFISSEVRPVGGDTQLIFNAEYRVPIIWRLSGAAFFDVGTSFDSRDLIRESFETITTVQSTGAPVTVLTVLKPLKPAQDFLPRYRYSLGGELRFPVPAANIPLRLIFAWNPNAQRQVPPGALLAPEKRFAFRVGFSRTL
ncbi:MAG TPA: BamA/TamA family outer membrane protein [Blastocatellia bacterium]|nr:BamA/TamA family outer membrane protein [Blastocatellia bacterium]